jgi:hypothetical protein
MTQCSCSGSSLQPSLSPSDLDWKIWSELVSIVEPMNSVSSLLQERRVSCLSLFWYVVDWLVCMYDQASSWEVYSVHHNASISVPTSSLCQPILSFQSTFSGMLRELYLTDLFKRRHPKQFELLCLVTFLDPRTKDFGFFHSQDGVCLDFPRLCQREARVFLMNELRNEVCSLFEVFLDHRHQRRDGHDHDHGDDSRSSIDDENGDEDDHHDPVHALLEELVVVSGLSHNSKKSSSSPLFTDSQGQGARSEGNSRNSDDFFQQTRSLEILSLEPSQKAALRKSIDDYCNWELLRYENEPIICPSHQIRHAQDPLHYWPAMSRKYAMISRVARRFLSLQMVSTLAPKVKDLTSRIYSKSRRTMCPILFEAVVFLHFNGILDHQQLPPESLGASSTPSHPHATRK